MTNDTKTTLAGSLTAALVAANVDWSKVSDPHEISKLLAAGMIAVWSWYTNK